MCSTKQTICKNIAVEYCCCCCLWCSHTSWWSSWWESFLEVFLEIISWFKEVTILSWNEGIMTYSHEFQHLPMILYKIGILHNNFKWFHPSQSLHNNNNNVQQAYIENTPCKNLTPLRNWNLGRFLCFWQSVEYENSYVL